MEHIALFYVIFTIAFASTFIGYQHGFIAGIGATKPNIFRVMFAALVYGIAWPYHLVVAFFR